MCDLGRVTLRGLKRARTPRVLALAWVILAGLGRHAAAAQPAPSSSDVTDRAVAERFAPVFHQGMVGSRFDFITNFDFDGDWVGDNNWANAANPAFAQRAYVYYAVSETPTHYFVHYAAFHPRDYKGGELTGAVLSQAVRRGAQASTRIRELPVANDVVLAHENDLEGCLVVVEKRGARLEDARVVIVETLAHNRYLKYQVDATLTGSAGTVRLDGGRPEIYVEPKGHGMEAFADQVQRRMESKPGSAAPAGTDGRTGLVGRMSGLIGDIDRTRRAVNGEQPETIRRYRFTGTAEDPQGADGDIGYALVPLFETMWAKSTGQSNPTFGEVENYGTREVSVAGRATPVAHALGRLGASFRGVQGAENKARPPWGWFDMSERDRPLGEWFFDPAAVVLRHFPKSGIDAAYVHQPFLGVTRTGTPKAP